MRALRVVGERQIIVRDVADPKPAPGEVLVEMKATAICGSDLHPYRHPTPLILENDIVPGHEPCGVISEVGDGVSGWNVGDRVVVYFRRTCGECYFCVNGQRNACLNRRVSYGHGPGADGSHAERMVVETGSLLRLPDYLSFVDGAVLACQAGTAFYPLMRMSLGGRDILAVSGLGPVGLLATMFATAMGARVFGIDPSAERRELAKKLGAETAFDPTLGPVAEQMRDCYPDGASTLIETSGSNAAHAVIGDILRPLGVAAIVGLGSQDFKMPIMRLVHREITLFGTSIYPNGEFETICKFVRDRSLSLTKIVTHYFPLEQAPEAFRIADSATAGKVCFTFD